MYLGNVFSSGCQALKLIYPVKEKKIKKKFGLSSIKNSAFADCIFFLINSANMMATFDDV